MVSMGRPIREDGTWQMISCGGEVGNRSRWGADVVVMLSIRGQDVVEDMPGWWCRSGGVYVCCVLARKSLGDSGRGSGAGGRRLQGMFVQ